MKAITTIREFKTENFKVIVDALPEFEPVDVDDDGETARQVDAGELVHFCARARVLYRGAEVASDYLGGCIYRTFEEFADHRACGVQNQEYAARGETGRCGSYFRQMIETAIAEARKFLADVPKLRAA